jgi:uncharacterized phiE125 gp8 family phage protein
MNAVLYTAPTLYPVSLSELKKHLKADSETFAGNIDETQSIAPGSHAIADNYTLVGAWVEVLGYESIVSFAAGTNGATGTVDVKIQESDDGITGTDWTGGAFTQVTTANDNATYEKAYTGTKRYIRTVAKVLLAACEFGTSVIRFAATTAEDDALTAILYASIEHIQDITGRKLLTQTWDYYLQEWPDKDFIKVPFGNLQNTTGVEPVVSWKGTDGTETTLTVTTDYLVETNGEWIGKIVLPYGGSWPSGSLYPSNPIKIRFTCGWTAAADVPYLLKSAILLWAENLHQHGGRSADLGGLVNNLVRNSRIRYEF